MKAKTTKKERLTRRQHETLEYIKAFRKEHGWMPTYSEIGSGMNTTASAAYLTVKRISEKGYMQQDRRARCLEIL